MQSVNEAQFSNTTYLLLLFGFAAGAIVIVQLTSI